MPSHEKVLRFVLFKLCLPTSVCQELGTTMLDREPWHRAYTNIWTVGHLYQGGPTEPDMKQAMLFFFKKKSGNIFIQCILIMFYLIPSLLLGPPPSPSHPSS